MSLANRGEGPRGLNGRRRLISQKLNNIVQECEHAHFPPYLEGPLQEPFRENRATQPALKSRNQPLRASSIHFRTQASLDDNFDGQTVLTLKSTVSRNALAKKFSSNAAPQRLKGYRSFYSNERQRQNKLSPEKEQHKLSQEYSDTQKEKLQKLLRAEESSRDNAVLKCRNLLLSRIASKNKVAWGQEPDHKIQNLSLRESPIKDAHKDEILNFNTFLTSIGPLKDPPSRPASTKRHFPRCASAMVRNPIQIETSLIQPVMILPTLKESKSMQRLKIRITEDFGETEGPVLSDLETRLLFEAKCKDLNIPEVESQYAKFRENQLLACKARTFSLVNAHIGPVSAKVIALIMMKNPNFCKFNLSQNSIGDEGAKVIAAAFASSKYAGANEDLEFPLQSGYSTLESQIMASKERSASRVSRMSRTSKRSRDATSRSRSRLGSRAGSKPSSRAGSRVGSRYAGFFSKAQSFFNHPFQARPRPEPVQCQVISLNLSTNSITSEGLIPLFRALKFNETLIELDISSKTQEGKNRNKVQKDSLVEMKSMLLTNRILQILDLSGNGIKEFGVRMLAEAYLEATKKHNYQANFVQFINRAEEEEAKEGPPDDLSLSSLNLSFNDIATPKAFEYLNTILSVGKNLQRLNLSYNPIKDTGIEIIFKAFGDDKEKEVMHYGSAVVGRAKKGADPFAAILKKSPLSRRQVEPSEHFATIKWLNMSQCQLGSKGLLALFKQLSNCKSLDTLICDRNEVNRNYDSINSRLGQSLAYLSVRHLSMVECGIDDTFASSLSYGLQYNGHIFSLNLAKNLIKDWGATEMFMALHCSGRTKTQLSELNLAQNKIGEKGGEALAKMLRLNTRIKKINMSFNLLTEAAGNAIILSLNSNSSLRQLDVKENQFQLRQIAEISTKLKKNCETQKSNEVPKFKSRRKQLQAINISKELGQVRKTIIAAEARMVLIKKETEKIEVESQSIPRVCSVLRGNLQEKFDLERVELRKVEDAELKIIIKERETERRLEREEDRLESAILSIQADSERIQKEIQELEKDLHMKRVAHEAAKEEMHFYLRMARSDYLQAKKRYADETRSFNLFTKTHDTLEIPSTKVRERKSSGKGRRRGPSFKRSRPKKPPAS